MALVLVQFGSLVRLVPCPNHDVEFFEHFMELFLSGSDHDIFLEMIFNDSLFYWIGTITLIFFAYGSHYTDDFILHTLCTHVIS